MKMTCGKSIHPFILKSEFFYSFYSDIIIDMNRSFWNKVKRNISTNCSLFVSPILTLWWIVLFFKIYFVFMFDYLNLLVKSNIPQMKMHQTLQNDPPTRIITLWFVGKSFKASMNGIRFNFWIISSEQNTHGITELFSVQPEHHGGLQIKWEIWGLEGFLHCDQTHYSHSHTLTPNFPSPLRYIDGSQMWMCVSQHSPLHALSTFPERTDLTNKTVTLSKASGRDL